MKLNSLYVCSSTVYSHIAQTNTYIYMYVCISINEHSCSCRCTGLPILFRKYYHIPKTPLAWKKLPKKGHFAHIEGSRPKWCISSMIYSRDTPFWSGTLDIGNEIKICSQNKCHHHLSNVCEDSFRMFHSNWVISDYHSFVWAVC